MIRLTIIAALFATAAQAQPIEPPARYRHAPNGPVIVNYVPYRDVDHECRARMHAWGNGQIEACTEGPIQILPDPCEYHDTYAKIACHEEAHSAGWPADHPRN